MSVAPPPPPPGSGLLSQLESLPPAAPPFQPARPPEHLETIPECPPVFPT